MKNIITELKEEWITGTWKPEKKELFGGAELIITKDPNRSKREGDVLVVSRYARELSALVFELRNRLTDYIDYSNKYGFYPRLGKAANKSIKTEGDHLSPTLSAMLEEALIIADEWDRYLYFAYGSNMAYQQMQYRCPGARLLSKGTVHGYRFTLDDRGVASIVRKNGNTVEGIVWIVTKSDIDSLDRYEGVQANCYRKETIPVNVDGETHAALVYLSDHVSGKIGHCPGYMEKIIRAAKEHGLSQTYIQQLEPFCN